ncbi:aromatic ring-hydroxylating dioxygenase subunit alpha [Sphingopyxis granuli]|uniref:aromatic ring-hydroxylating oxygenase subunit alpha n=1 Tax=Sphingopyxis granuli TaxID=267128 RepID=UPI001F5366DC|nr:aromatic ring-hydroxylating dioxygenase subunit alpha [Sphingopyxis granuli]UNK81078.1 aromatic ring-hydroxylating dioxygenase subunit alpha [Sphingopyxis granuli]
MSTTVSPPSNNQGWIIDDRERGLFKVDREAFTSPEILALERERIFDRSWLFLGHASELPKPNDFITRRVGGRDLIFNRNRKGEFQAIINACPHRGAQVERQPCGNAISFKCFYHGWAFNNNGRFATRSPEGVYPSDFGDDGSVDLVRVPRIDSYRDFYFINYDSEAISLKEYLAGSAEVFDLLADHSPNGMEIVGGAQEYSVRANWKLLVENSYDGYHAAETHSTYFEYLLSVIGMSAEEVIASMEGETKGLDLGNGHSMIEGRGPWGRPIGRPIPAWGDEGRAEIEAIKSELRARVGPERAERIATYDRNLGVFPNLVINDIMAITVRTFYPEAPDLMSVTSWAFAPKGETRELRKRRLDNFLEFLGPGGFATPDDVEALESAQRGYASAKFARYNDISRGALKKNPGGNDENQMRAFWREWNRRVGGC